MMYFIILIIHIFSWNNL